MTTTAPRADFEARHPFPLDDFQRRALDALDAGGSVLVAAPTGSGKTLVAEYAVALALHSGQKAFYTTPLKALSNQKYGDFVRDLGADQVGLLTGDNSINGDAPVVVMTTEVLRNMIYARSPTLDGLRYVVLDEVHYLQNRYRGAVWEEVIIHLPPTVDLVCLSATVSNAEEFADWIRTVRGDTEAVIEETRPVELVHLYAVGDRGSESMHLLPTFVTGPDGELRPNPEAARLDQSGSRGARPPGRRRGRLATPWREEVIERLADERMLPAIVFVFSRAGCDAAVTQCVASGLRLTTSEEARELQRIAEAHTNGLDADDLDALGYDAWLGGLLAGFAAHHAGMVPPMKEAVEEAFTAGLVKAVFATETLSLGINMPARTVVIEKLSKFTGEHHEFLTPGEYTQLAGRAGRRGIDDLGFVVVLWNPFVTFDQVAGLASRRTYALTSSFRPTYNMAVNLVRRYPAAEARHLLNLSCAQSERGDVDEYRAIKADLEVARKAASEARPARLEALRPGDVVSAPRRGGRVVVLKQDRGRGGNRVLALTEGRDLVRLGPDDFRDRVRRLATIELPRPFRPNDQRFQRVAADALRRLPAAENDPDVSDATRDRVERLERSLAEHPLANAPERTRVLRAAAAADRIERDIARQERRVAGRTESLARQLDRVLALLESWGYVEGWELTPAGELLARLYTETDLVVAESLREGLLDELDPAEMAGLVSCFTYERRGPDADTIQPPAHWPSARVAKRARAIERVWRDLMLSERDGRLPETRQPDPGLVPMVAGWVRGDDLSTILEDGELTGGDFVRNVKQCIDLLRQIGDVAPDPTTAATARAAADACSRGVVAASSVIHVP